MESVGIVRRIDNLGRVVIPMEIRRRMGIEPGTPMEMFIMEDGIVIKKYTPGCQGCGQMKGLESVSGVILCRDCCEKLLEMFKSV